MENLLHIDVSVQADTSKTRKISQLIIDLVSQNDNIITKRDLNNNPIPFLDGRWAGATFTPADKRNRDQIDKLSFSSQLVNEIAQADTIVIGSPIYNFSIAASLKAWIDMICRVGLTFSYTKNGPIGLMKNKKVIVAIASGGTKVGSEMDFASNYLVFIFGFIGIKNVTIVDINNIDLEKGDAFIKTQLQEQIQ